MITYVIMCWFFFFLMNYADITARPAKWLRGVLGTKLSYATGCALCSCFWLTLVLVIFTPIPVYWMFVAPVLHLFLDLAYQRLSGNCPPCNGGSQ